MKIRYSYNEYKGHPEATEISKSRGIAFTFYCIALGWAVLFSIIALIADFVASWYIAIPVIILSGVGFWYLVTRYNTVTERKIAKAIADKNKEKQKKLAEEYICLYIYRLDNYKRGRCEKCGAPSEALRECLVKDRDGDGSTFLCNSCITKYLQNKR